MKTLLCAIIYFGGLATIAVSLIKLAIFIWAGTQAFCDCLNEFTKENTMKTLLCAIIYFGGLATVAVVLIKLAIFIWAGIF